MESNAELKEIHIKNRMSYHFDDVIRVRDFGFDILLAKKSYENSHENSLIYDSSYKTFLGTKPLCIRFEKIDGFH